MFEAINTDRVAASAERVWALWADPDRWARWNEQVESVEREDEAELTVGEKLAVKFNRGGKVEFEVIELDAERVLTIEARFPGARFGHEHRMKPGRSSVEVTHRLYVSGAAAGFWSLMLSRKRMRELVVSFTKRERELTAGG